MLKQISHPFKMLAYCGLTLIGLYAVLHFLMFLLDVSMPWLSLALLSVTLVTGLLLPLGYVSFIRSWRDIYAAQQQRIIELQEKQAAAEQASLAKSQFIASMSHELRTPLNAVIGYSEILKEEAEDLNATNMVKDLHKIHVSGKQVLDLINNVLDISKIEAGKMDVFFEPFDLRTLIEEIAITAKPLVAKKDNHLRLKIPDDPGMMVSDVTKLRQSLLNLLSNASKFTEQGMITLSLSRELTEARDWLIFVVEDTGIGMDEEQQAKLFKPFVQAEDAGTTRKYGGTGLGLALSKYFIEMLGGEIQLYSIPKQGTRFTLRLPNQSPSSVEQETAKNLPKAAPTLQKTPSPIVPQRVLVIDDDSNTRDILRTHLLALGYQVMLAENGEVGLQQAKEWHPDLITLDVMMPNMDGWMVLSTLKNNALLKQIPVVMLTMVDDKSTAAELGAADYLIKPVTREQLANIAKRFIRPAADKLADAVDCLVNPQHRHQHHNSEAPLLMVVDDDEITRDMLCAILKRAGWQVTSASSGMQALHRLNTQKPDLILLDLLMPEMGGFEFVTFLRRMEDFQDVPVVVMSAKDISGDDKQLLTHSVQGILQKGSCSREELVAEIRELLTVAYSGSFVH